MAILRGFFMGRDPFGIAANPATNTTYVSNSDSATVSVLR
jgi:DNA-binding beta-propeller fold protein YncE